MLIRILIATESSELQRRVARLLARPGVLAHPADPPGGLWEGLARNGFDLIVVDRAALPEPAAEAIATIRKLPDRPELIVLQGGEDPRDRAALLAAGAMAVPSQNLPDEILAPTLDALVERRREALRDRLCAEHRSPAHRLTDLASSSPAMRSVIDLAQRVAAADSSLLIRGETGVGKEWLARAIHGLSRRAAAPFIAVNCAAVTDTLLESELFGHEKGAFTGAVRSRRGFCELAHRGTLFLDEIGDMPPPLQAKLLRFLQEHTIFRVGGERPIDLEVRVMAATNHDLERAMAAGTFRRDLYYRLGAISLDVPPLRERREDIAALVESYRLRFQAELGRHLDGIQPAALEALVAHPWPGNVRELINVVERAVLLCRGAEISLDDLPESIARPDTLHTGVALPAAVDALAPVPPEWLERPLKSVRREAIQALERGYLSEQLRRTGGRVGETARRAGLAPRSLFQKMSELGLRKEDFRPPRPGSPTPSRPV